MLEYPCVATFDLVLLILYYQNIGQPGVLNLVVKVRERKSLSAIFPRMIPWKFRFTFYSDDRSFVLLLELAHRTTLIT